MKLPNCKHHKVNSDCELKIKLGYDDALCTLALCQLSDCEFFEEL